MTDPANPAAQSNAKAWSDRIADRYACALSPALADWFDSEIWAQTGIHEYCDPVSPATLLDETPDVIWPGLMNANLVPLIANMAGDWLCGRIDPDNRIGQIVQWYHGGGDWIIWGNDLPEAIAFDALVSRLPGQRRRHAIPADDFFANSTASSTAGSTASENTGPLVQWASRHLPDAIQKLVNSPESSKLDDANRVANQLIEHGIAEVTVRCELVQDALQLSTLALLERDVLLDLEIDPGSIAQWAFDHDTIPERHRDAIVTALKSRDLADGFVQQWDVAETHAEVVTRIAPDTAWGWDIAGYAALRRGDRELAKRRFLSGIDCSCFSDQSIRLETHWTSQDASKFSAAMLAKAFPETLKESEYLRCLCIPNLIERSDSVSEHWRGLAEAATSSGRNRDAHDHLVAAGWDIGMRPITAFGELIQRIGDTADRSGQKARAATARIHRACLKDRYGA
ncbi:SMI1/KNR4 family protein [Rubripirellula reticaptiva]|uniref:Uncharacterized protein n=1 Tax=Rubripirellula reticaptiva TaxID=2528013 RepID=A0A5C6EHL5_9BACT|nr:SMI1/KNR4 family protein [Rubripirellula reticaptiva]TWU48318.1 hypothetical protein Poly59_51640 [Rubripirellula reticaptiva]